MCDPTWRYYYWYLTNEGIEYLREYLNLSADVVPNTLKKATRPATRELDGGAARGGAPPGGGGPGGGAPARGPDRFDARGPPQGGSREGYRSERPAGGGFGRGGGGDKGGAPGGFNPEFGGGRGGGGGGFGRGGQ
jgi:small subunit ribosomal protein S10e